jgi:hypothetical protein
LPLRKLNPEQVINKYINTTMSGSSIESKIIIGRQWTDLEPFVRRYIFSHLLNNTDEMKATLDHRAIDAAFRLTDWVGFALGDLNPKVINPKCWRFCVRNLEQSLNGFAIQDDNQLIMLMFFSKDKEPLISNLLSPWLQSIIKRSQESTSYQCHKSIDQYLEQEKCTEVTFGFYASDWMNQFQQKLKLRRLIKELSFENFNHFLLGEIEGIRITGLESYVFVELEKNWYAVFLIKADKKILIAVRCADSLFAAS